MKQALILILLSSLIKFSYSQDIPQYAVNFGDAESSTGYYFLQGFKVMPPQNFTSMILDRYGRLIYFKKFNTANSDFKIQPNGKITQASATGNDTTGKFIVLDSMFNIVDSVKCPGGIFTDLHDIRLLSNGNYLVMGFEFRIMDLTSYHWFSGNGSPGSPNARVKGVVILELDENNNAVFVWNSFDHFQFDDVSEQWLGNPVNVDWTHSNAAALDNDGNILLSSRHFNEITKINRQTGAVIWRLGGKRNQFTFVNDQFNGFWGQHYASRIQNGNLTLYDNGFRRITPFHPARALEYSLNESALTATLVWNYTYDDSAYSIFMGNAIRLENGNTLIDWGRLSGGNSVFRVVKPDGNLVIDVYSSDSMISYRTFNYTTLPFTLQRPALSCYESSGNFYLEAPPGHSSYKWSTGETSRIIQINVPDTYYVFVPYGSAGGYISSEYAVVTNMNSPCESIGITHNNNETPSKYRLYQNYPNPFNPATKIKFDIPVNIANARLTIYDVTGREVEVLINQALNAGSYTVDWNGTNYASGVYYYKLQAEEYSDIKKMVLLK
jgi:hypothetical protein